MKHCDTMRQPCPNKPECQGCEALEQRNSDGSYDGIEMATTWRDWLRLSDIVSVVVVILFVGWISQTPFVAAFLKGLI